MARKCTLAIFFAFVQACAELEVVVVVVVVVVFVVLGFGKKFVVVIG